MLGIEHKCGVKGDQDNDRIMSHLLSAAQIRPGASPCLILPFWLQAPSKRNTPLVVCLAVCMCLLFICCCKSVVSDLTMDINITDGDKERDTNISTINLQPELPAELSRVRCEYQQLYVWRDLSVIILQSIRETSLSTN